MHACACLNSASLSALLRMYVLTARHLQRRAEHLAATRGQQARSQLARITQEMERIQSALQQGLSEHRCVCILSHFESF